MLKISLTVENINGCDAASSAISCALAFCIAVVVAFDIIVFKEIDI